jgi:hypothetical protein
MLRRSKYGLTLVQLSSIRPASATAQGALWALASPDFNFRPPFPPVCVEDGNQP